MGKSLAVKDQTQSLFADDVDATIAKALFVDDFDYGGTRDSVFALQVTFEVEGLDDPIVQHYTAGEKNVVADDGDGFDGPGIGETTNCGKLLKSLIDSGFDDEELAKGKISCIEGLNVHLVQQAQPLNKNAKPGERPRTLLVVNAINDGTPEPKGKVGPKQRQAPSAAGKGKGDVKAKTAAAIKAIVDAQGGPVAIGKLTTLLFKAHKQDPDLKKMQELASDEDFLVDASGDETFSFDGTKVGPAE